MREFNACVPYEGLSPSADVPDVLPMAVLSMLPSPAPLTEDTLPHTHTGAAQGPLTTQHSTVPPPSAGASATLVGLLAALRRLARAEAVFSLIIGMPGAILRILGLCRSASDAVAMEATGMLLLCQGVPAVSHWYSTAFHKCPTSVWHSTAVLLYTTSLPLICYCCATARPEYLTGMLLASHVLGSPVPRTCLARFSLAKCSPAWGQAANMRWKCRVWCKERKNEC